MREQITAGILTRHLHICGQLMGWDTQGPVWSSTFARDKEGRTVRVSNVGAVFLQRVSGRNGWGTPGWRVVEITNREGGERDLTPSYTARELLAWFDGIQKHGELVRCIPFKVQQPMQTTQARDANFVLAPVADE